MALKKKLSLVLAFAFLAVSAAAREVPFHQKHHRYSLEARLTTGLDAAGGGGLANCWSALLDLRSCTNEIVLFFLNGEAYLGQGCCRAIRVITRQCWPSMLSSVGFTAEEGDILKDYCDAGAATGPSSSPATPSLPPLSPVTAPLMGPVAADIAFASEGLIPATPSLPPLSPAPAPLMGPVAADVAFVSEGLMA